MTNPTLGAQIPELTPSDETIDHSLSSRTSLSSAIARIPVTVQIVIGTAQLPLSQVSQLTTGSTLTLNEKLGAPARMLVNGREIARGDLFVVDESEGRLGLTIRHIVGAETAS
ncbi:FliM/FliN family flagellar motor switch protein [Aestuariivirga sp.]|jgi:flagellar motor switch protein FliN/FliY|uniref:FliM/FliN family flagellar motor switch protein n=1 Tax=Aestuariivirga sp. TaxID=2650926 RepID=UPI003782F13B